MASIRDVPDERADVASAVRCPHEPHHDHSAQLSHDARTTTTGARRGAETGSVTE
jgi:hypothetical protein